MADQDSQLAELMRAASRGDADAYRRAAGGLAPILRGLAKRGFSRYGLGPEEVEDVVQETLLAVHLKRQTWDERQPLLPWVRAIAQNKLVDNLRRRGRRVHVPIDDVSEALAVDEEPAAGNSVDAERILASLKGRAARHRAVHLHRGRERPAGGRPARHDGRRGARRPASRPEIHRGSIAQCLA